MKDSIFWFSIAIQYLPGRENAVTDALSRIASITENIIDFFEMAGEKATDAEFKEYTTPISVR